MPATPLPALPLYLTLYASAWTSSITACACLKDAWARSSRPDRDLANALAHLPEEISAQAHRVLEETLKGVSLYHDAEYRRPPETMPAVWCRGAARLLAYYPAEGKTRDMPPVLFVPSLINRYYVLDLEPERSFLRHLTREGVTALVLDWGMPGEHEKHYACEEYVTDPLLGALDFVTATAGRPPVLAGYCMGGVLALAAALLKPGHVAGLALFATPWDFGAPDVTVPRLDEKTLALFETWINTLERLPPECLHLLFYWQDPWLFEQKFRHFASLSPGSAAFKEFMAVEHWVNDGVPLTRGVARDCLIEWGQRNALARGRWHVQDTRIVPEAVACPAFAVAARHDRIVPSACAQALIRRLPDVTLCEPATGHVGMMVGRRAREQMWSPFIQWLLGF